MKPLSELTDLQIEILSVLWAQGEATATDVHRALAPSSGLNRKTIGTLLARMESYGVLTHREEGREFVYRPLVGPEQVREAKTRSVLGQVFGGRVSELVSYALESAEVLPGDVERIRRMIEGWERERDPEAASPSTEDEGAEAPARHARKGPAPGRTGDAAPPGHPREPGESGQPGEVGDSRGREVAGGGGEAER